MPSIRQRMIGRLLAMSWLSDPALRTRFADKARRTASRDNGNGIGGGDDGKGGDDGAAGDDFWSLTTAHMMQFIASAVAVGLDYRAAEEDAPRTRAGTNEVHKNVRAHTCYSIANPAPPLVREICNG